MRTQLYTLLIVTWLCSRTVLAVNPHASDIRQLIAELDRTRIEFNVPAIGFTLVSGDVILWSGAWGTANIETGQQANAATLFRIGSVTKAFTALAILMLQEQGKLSLEDTVRSRSPDAPFTNRWEDTHPVRIAHLLEHTAGFLDLTRAEFDHSDPKPLTLEEALTFHPASRITQWPPGLHSSYSNSGAGLVAFVLERVTGQRYEAFVRESLFRPLEMSTAGFFLDKHTNVGLAIGYDTDGRTRIPYWHMIFRAFGGINATPLEMAGFLQMLINKGRFKKKRLLSAASIKRMEVPQTTLAARSGLSFGYGLGNYQFHRDGFVFHGHGGDGDGYLSFYAYNRDANLAYFVVINAFKNRALSALRRQIENYMIRDLQSPETRTPNLNGNELRRFVGLYQPVTLRFPWEDRDEIKKNVLTVTLEDGNLYEQQRSGKKFALIPVSKNHFRYRNETQATMAFVEDEAGNLYLQNEDGNFIRIAS